MTSKLLPIALILAGAVIVVLALIKGTYLIAVIGIGVLGTGLYRAAVLRQSV